MSRLSKIAKREALKSFYQTGGGSLRARTIIKQRNRRIRNKIAYMEYVRKTVMFSLEEINEAQDYILSIQPNTCTRDELLPDAT